MAADTELHGARGLASSKRRIGARRVRAPGADDDAGGGGVLDPAGCKLRGGMLGGAGAIGSPTSAPTANRPVHRQHGSTVPRVCQGCLQTRIVRNLRIGHGASLSSPFPTRSPATLEAPGYVGQAYFDGASAGAVEATFAPHRAEPAAPSTGPGMKQVLAVFLGDAVLH